MYIITVEDITIFNEEAIITEHADGAEWAPQVPPAAAAANALLPGTCQQYHVNAMLFVKCDIILYSQLQKQLGSIAWRLYD